MRIINYQKISKFDIANGPGIRTVLWVSGCSHHCLGCHNPQTWNPSSGQPFHNDALEEIIDSLKPDYISGITLSGGDPLYEDNRVVITSLSKLLRELYPHKSIWVYTGYLYEDVMNLPIMDYIDVLVDGEFILSQRDITLLYKGSPNQRVIDVKKSKASNSIILYEE